MSSLIIIIALFAVLWFVMIRPQRAKQQKQRELLNSVAPGDEILTVGGLYGIVQEIEADEDGDEGDDLVVEIAEGIHVRVARRAVATVVKPESDDEEDEEGEEDDDVRDVEDDVEPVDDTEPAGAAVEPEAAEGAGGEPSPRTRRRLRRGEPTGDSAGTDAPEAASSPERS